MLQSITYKAKHIDQLICRGESQPPLEESIYRKDYFERLGAQGGQQSGNAKKKDNFAERQRAAMTPSLRYEILARDGFRCVKCGRSPKEDGVKLHVDHIVPVSKGGKTEKGNLQTLCEECNYGKGSKVWLGAAGTLAFPLDDD